MEAVEPIDTRNDSGADERPASPRSVFKRLMVAGGLGILITLPWLVEGAFITTWLGMTALIALTLHQPAFVAFRLWIVAGLAGMALAFHWLPEAIHRQLEVSDFASLVMASWAIVWDAFRLGVFGWLATTMSPKIGGRILIWPALWVALEWAWPHVFPWRLGQTQIYWLSLCQISEVTGVYGISFLLIAGCTVFAEAFTCKRTSSGSKSRSKRIAAGYCVLLMAISCWGWLRIQRFDRRALNDEEIRVAVVQAGSRENLLPNLRDLSKALPEEIDLVIWGEASVDSFDLGLQSFATDEVVQQHHRFGESDRAPCPGLGVALLCGGGSFAVGANESGPFRNTAYLLDAEERIIARYHKRILMPWGEYAWGQQWLPGLREFLTTADSMQAGESAAPLLHPNRARIGVLICYEDLMPDPSRETVLEGAEVLVNLNNLDAFGETVALAQHQMLARFRAIECRRWLVRAGSNGTSSIITATGSTEQELPTHRPGILSSSIPLRSSLSFYCRWGDVFVWLCLGGSLIVLASHWTRRRLKVRKKERSPNR